MAEGVCRADTWHTLQRWQDVDVGIVCEELCIVSPVFARQRIDEEHARLALLRRHPDAHDVRGEEGLSLLYAVLHVHRCHVGVGTFLEVDGDGGAARVRGGRGHVGHAFDPVDLLFEGDDDGVEHRLGVRTCVGCGDLHGGRCEVGVLLDRQLYEPDDPEDDDDDGDHRREHGAGNKSIEIHCSICFRLRRWGLSASQQRRPCPSSAGV